MLPSDHLHSPAAWTPPKGDAGSCYTEGWVIPRTVLGASSKGDKFATFPAIEQHLLPHLLANMKYTEF
jgi:hypothetical protein